MRAARGFTLLEILLTSGLSLVILSLLLESWLLASRAWTQAEQTQSAQRSTLALSYRLQHDFGCSLVGSLYATDPTNPNCVSFVSDDAPAWSPSGSMLFRHWVQYRWDPGTQIVERRESDLTPPSETPPGGPPVWSLSERGTSVGQSISRFQAASPNYGPRLSLRLEATYPQSSSSLDLEILSRFYSQN